MVAGCAQGWLLVLPVALPVVPPVVDEAEPVEEFCAGEAGVTVEGLCAGEAGVTAVEPCAAVPAWLALLVVLVLPDWLAVLLGFCVSTLDWLCVPVARSVASGTPPVRPEVEAPVVLPMVPVVAWFCDGLELWSLTVPELVLVCAIARPVPRIKIEVA